MSWLVVVLGCTGAPSVAAGVPRSPEAATARLEALGVGDVACEGGALGDEVSLACTGTWKGRAVSVDAVTSGAPLPETPGVAAAMVEDLWVEVRVVGPLRAEPAMAAELLGRYAASEEGR